MFEGTLKPWDASCSIETADRPIRLISNSYFLDRVDIRAASDNSGDVWVGGSAISSVAGQLLGHRLQANDVLTLENVDLSDWFVVGGTPGDYVYWGGERDG